VLACRGCGGVFVGVELGLRLLAVLRADVPPLDEDDPHVSCPVCRAAMRSALPQGVDVRVEVCRHHGVWFIDDDLVIVTRAVAKALGKPVPEVVASLDAQRVAPRPAESSTPPAQDASPTSARTSSPTTPEHSGPRRPASGTTFGEGVLGRSASRPTAHQGVLAHATETTLDVVDVGVSAVGTAVEIVALPVELSLAIVGGLGELFD